MQPSPGPSSSEPSTGNATGRCILIMAAAWPAEVIHVELCMSKEGNTCSWLLRVHAVCLSLTLRWLTRHWVFFFTSVWVSILRGSRVREKGVPSMPGKEHLIRIRGQLSPRNIFIPHLSKVVLPGTVCVPSGNGPKVSSRSKADGWIKKHWPSTASRAAVGASLLSLPWAALYPVYDQLKYTMPHRF